MSFDTETLANNCIYTQTLSQRNPCIRRPFYTKTLLYRDAFTHKPCDTQMILYKDTSKYRGCYTQTISHTNTRLPRHIYTQTLLQTELVAQVPFTYKPLLFPVLVFFIHKFFYIRTLFCTDPVIHRFFHTNKLSFLFKEQTQKDTSTFMHPHTLMLIFTLA